MKLEIVQNSDGERVKQLVLQSGVRYVDDLDWSNIFPFWLGIRRSNKLIGVIQVCFGLPIGRLELMSVDPGLPHRLRAAVVRVEIVDARSGHPVVDLLRDKQVDLDEGMAFVQNGRVSHGDECIHKIALLTTPSNTFNRLKWPT